jgi:hypothetical protein
VVLGGDRFDRNGVELIMGIDSLLKAQVDKGEMLFCIIPILKPGVGKMLHFNSNKCCRPMAITLMSFWRVMI